jgi:hypothetical protein
METRQMLERISNLKESEIGPTEENVKQKVIVPLLEILGHKRENLEFEYRTRGGGKLDIFIKNVPVDCKVIIDTKNYTENLNDYIDQIKTYTFDESAFLTLIANGKEIRIYSLLRGIAFERSLLYSIKREDFSKDFAFKILTDLLKFENLNNKNAHQKVVERELEIKNAMSQEENLKNNIEQKVEEIESEIENKEDEIESLKQEKEKIEKEFEIKTSEIWNGLGLPLALFNNINTYVQSGDKKTYLSSGTRKAGKVFLHELIEAGLLRDKQTLYFYNTKLFKEEQAEVISQTNRLKYKKDGNTYSISDLAKVLLINHGFKSDAHGVAGPKYWMTDDGKLLNDLNEQIRNQRGDRK